MGPTPLLQPSAKTHLLRIDLNAKKNRGPSSYWGILAFYHAPSSEMEHKVRLGALPGEFISGRADQEPVCQILFGLE